MKVTVIARADMPAIIKQAPAPERIAEFKRLLDVLTGDKAINIVPQEHETLVHWIESAVDAARLLGIQIAMGTTDDGALRVWRRDAPKPKVPDTVTHITSETLLMAATGTTDRAALVQRLTEARRKGKRGRKRG